MKYEQLEQNLIEKIIDKIDLLTGLKIEYIQMFNDVDDKSSKILEIEKERTVFLDNLKKEGITEGLKDQVCIYCDNIIELYSKFMNNFISDKTIDKEYSSQRINSLKVRINEFKEELIKFEIAQG